MGYNNHWNIPFFKNVGDCGVVLFFVLSGFLITYLLLSEKKEFGKIAILDFYIRRILRIWPLYYLMVFFGLFIAPHITFLRIPLLTSEVQYHFLTKCFLFFTILPNTANFMFNTIPFLGQAWSIGAEEQFYLVWPWIIKYARNYFKVFIAVVVGMGLLTLLVFILPQVMHLQNIHSTLFKIISFGQGYLGQVRIGCMAIGAVGAYLVFYQKRNALAVIYSPLVQVIVWASVILFCGMGYEFPFANYEMYAVLFCIIILNVSCNNNSLLNLENGAFDFLGKISFGLYMYHQLATVIMIHLLSIYVGFSFKDYSEEAILYALTILLTIIIAALSYTYYEKPFLKLKNRFEKIKSIASLG